MQLLLKLNTNVAPCAAATAYSNRPIDGTPSEPPVQTLHGESMQHGKNEKVIGDLGLGPRPSHRRMPGTTEPTTLRLRLALRNQNSCGTLPTWGLGDHLPSTGSSLTWCSNPFNPVDCLDAG
jgi:hypothetical protein